MGEPTQAIAKHAPQQSLIATMAERYNMAPEMFLEAVKATCMPTKDVMVTNAHMAAFLMVSHEYGLNPLIREIFAFPTKSGGIQPIVSVDGWVHLITTNPNYAGMEITMELDEKKQKPISCTCQIFRKDAMKVPAVTEYYDECYRNTDPWNKMPKRMMRHKAIKEAGRVAFGFGGLMDQDEGIDAINITNESTVMERSTMTQAENLKEQIGAKKSSKKKDEPQAPATTTAPAAPVSAPAPTPAQEPAQAPAETVTAPAAAPTPEVAKVTADHKKAFLAKAADKARSLGVSEDQAKAKMRELLFAVGSTQFMDLTMPAFNKLMESVDSWTVQPAA